MQGTRIVNIVMASRNLLRSYLCHCWSDVIMSISDVIFFAIELDWIVWNSRFVIEGRLDGMEFAFRCKAPQS